MPNRANDLDVRARLEGTGLALPGVMSTPRVLRLRALFSALVGTLGATASATLLPACSGSVIDASTFDTNACGDELDGVTPSSPVDYLEVRSENDISGTGPTGSPNVVAKRGIPCDTAQDKVACENKLAALRPTNLQSPKAIDHFDGRYVVFTRGDEVGAITTREELRTFLAPFENPKDGALLLLEFTEHRISCDGANVRPVGSGFEFRTETGFACGEGSHRDAHVVSISETGELAVIETERLEDGDPGCAIGRRPEGYAPRSQGTSLGDYLAMSAELEAASVPAFRRLARELRAHGAPRELVSRAEKAARDEVRHARMTQRLAERFGGAPKLPRIGKLPVRSLEAIAEENAREGCVRETFGALVASVQAQRATDEGIRAAMEAIAVDETEHAALAWDVAAWLDTQIDSAGRDAARRAKRAAYASLLDSVRAGASIHADGGANDGAQRTAATPRPTTASLRLGLPSPAEELRLLQDLASTLFLPDTDVFGEAA
jgi:bacterioferritin (cytochrome b1)